MNFNMKLNFLSYAAEEDFSCFCLLSNKIIKNNNKSELTYNVTLSLNYHNGVINIYQFSKEIYKLT